MDSKKKTIILTVLGVITLIVFAVGVTYAYFTAQGNNVSQADVNVKTATTDSLIFTTGNNISFTADQSTFAKGMGNKEGSSYAKATLKANNSTNSATANYYVYLDITNNTFKHTTTAKTGELILTVIDPEGSPVTSINGLDYVTVNGISGFDITEATSLITIVDNHEIVSTGTKEEKWDITITLVNLDEDQSANAGSSFTAKLKIQKEKEERKETLATSCTGQNMAECIKNNYEADTSIISFKSTDEGGARDDSFRYTGGDYALTEKATAAGYVTIQEYASSNGTGLIGYYCDGSYNSNEYCRNTPTYRLSYNKNTDFTTISEAITKAIEDGYLSKDNVKNFICFGYDASSCPSDNLYRIIGVFNNNLKLIKSSFANSNLLGTNGDFDPDENDYYDSNSKNKYYFWNYNATSAASVDWNSSLLNTVNLNTNFLNTFGDTWKAKIANTSWRNAYADYHMTSMDDTSYYEITSTNTYNTAKIGIMYMSDYGYAVSPKDSYGNSVWNSSPESYSGCKYENWMWSGENEWTLSKYSSYSNSALIILKSGGVNWNTTDSHWNAVRPTFYLNSDVKLVSGTGTSSDPYRIS